mmetsp:Transcript_12099/g.15840  ORF Transcript_12099/g.15840 Transcript_12099/m.15840 type:complete len:97 (-) Transcript_12099:238-528(-)
MIYRSMGGGKISIFKVMRVLRGANRRWSENGVKSGPSSLGDTNRTMQGGILIFDRNGVLKYSYAEEYGVELNMDMIAAAIKEIRSSGDQDNRRSTM